MIRTLVLLGATGDLSRRFLLPALGALDAAGRLPDGFRVRGAARSLLDEDGIRRLAGNDIPAGLLSYSPVDLADPTSLAGVFDGTDEPVAVYLALPPGMFATTIEALCPLRLASGSRIVVEKPFGENLESAHELNVLLARTGLDAYRVDHVLGMETVQSIVSMRRDNPVLERLWGSETVEEVEILWEETLALEGRAGYYDHTGALKDVLQSHMLQLLALLAMNQPAGDGDLHDLKCDVLTSVCAPARSRRARYVAGMLADGREVEAYADERGVDPERGTETFAEVVLELDHPRWHGTPFVLRTGKALARRRKLVLLRFRGGGELELGVDGPRDVALRLAGAERASLELRATRPDGALPPYAHVLLDVLRGDHALSVGPGEAEQAWRIVAPVLAAWQRGDVPLEEYPAGHDVATTYATNAA